MRKTCLFDVKNRRKIRTKGRQFSEQTWLAVHSPMHILKT